MNTFRWPGTGSRKSKNTVVRLFYDVVKLVSGNTRIINEKV
ncbi:hypothetical protein V6Z11_A13G068800 [Gossypium hirsutum]